MRSIHKHRTPQQVLDWYPHPIPQPDTEEARQARVAQRFRLYFLLDAERKTMSLGKKAASAERTRKASLLLPEVEAMKTLISEPQNAFLLRDHARPVDDLLADLRALAA